MPDGTAPPSVEEEEVDFAIRIACECYCNLDLVREALSRQPVMNGALAWGLPRTPGSAETAPDADLVLIIADHGSLGAAMTRSLIYKQAGRRLPSHLLIYLQDEGAVSPQKFSGLILPRTQLATGLSSLTRVILEPLVPQGLICVDWADTRHILDMDGLVVIEEASAARFEDAVDSMMTRLRSCAACRPVEGVQASLLCDTGKLRARNVHDLKRAIERQTEEDATIIIAAPWMERPGDDQYELRLFARIRCD